MDDLRREVEVMRSLNHPNLLRLHEVIDDRDGGKVLMVMEFAEAGALVAPNQLTPERRMPEPMAQYYFRQMAAGLAHLHANHVVRGQSQAGGDVGLHVRVLCGSPLAVLPPQVHGDMKPDNVMLSGSGTVKIGDFGQSQFFDRRDTFQRTLGTPAYLGAPCLHAEQCRV